MKKERFGFIIIGSLLILAALLWASIKPFGLRFASINSTLTSLGQLAGLFGTILFSIVIVLSARLKWMEEWFGGLNHIYINHHNLGGLSLILLMFHPLILGIKFTLYSTNSGALFLLGQNSDAHAWGLYSLLLMMALLGLTFYAKLPYRIWKVTHKFLGLAYVLATVHVVLVYSDISESIVLRIFLMFIIALGYAALFYRVIFGFWFVAKYKYVVQGIRELPGGLFEIKLDSQSPLSFRSGQFIFIKFSQNNFSNEWHPFTISSGPSESQLSLVIKNLGDYTANLGKLLPGTKARIEGPFGKFSFLQAKNNEQVWLAGGIGITPFLSMINDLEKYSDYKVTLFYCAKNAIELIFIDRMKDFEKKLSSFRVVAHCSEESGHISARVIQDTIGDLADKDYFICGPGPMMRSLREQLVSLGINDSQIHSEDFNMFN